MSRRFLGFVVEPGKQAACGVMMMRFGTVLLIGLALSLSACGMRVPDIQEAWEPVGVKEDLVLKIKTRIYCEVVRAIRETRKSMSCGRNGKNVLCLPDDYGVQIQTTITVEESTALNPSVGFLDAWSKGTISTNINGSFSSAATRIDTAYSYHNIARLVRDDVNEICNIWKEEIDYNGSSMLLRTDLGIKEYLEKTLFYVRATHSQASPKPGPLAGQAKQAKFDVFSYQVKFVVVTSGGVNPVLKLTSLATGVSGPALLAAGRTRTHELTLTFGPGKDVPDLAALQVHNRQVLGPQQK